MSLLACQHSALFTYVLWYQKVVEGSLAQRNESFPPSHVVTPTDASHRQTLTCVGVRSAGVRGWQVLLQLSLLLLAMGRGSRQHRSTPTCLQLRFHPSHRHGQEQKAVLGITSCFLPEAVAVTKWPPAVKAWVRPPKSKD